MSDKTNYLVILRGLTNSDYYKCSIIKETTDLQEAYEFAVVNGYKTSDISNSIKIVMEVKPYPRLFPDWDKNPTLILDRED